MDRAARWHWVWRAVTDEDVVLGTSLMIARGEPPVDQRVVHMGPGL